MIHPELSNVNWCRLENKKIEVGIPKMIKMYNENMGGVDLMNQNVIRYRVGIKGNKWWWSLYTWLLDVTVHNAWQLYQLKKREDTFWEFCSDIAM